MADRPCPIAITIVGFLYFIVGVLELLSGIGLMLLEGLAKPISTTT
jgi:hypothetical protein